MNNDSLNYLSVLMQDPERNVILLTENKTLVYENNFNPTFSAY